MKSKFSTHGLAETEAVGERLASLLQGGDIVSLQGELGSGKTAFVRGLARGLGVKEIVSSPTFVLQHVFSLPPDSRIKELHHLDLYRLTDSRELLELGWNDLVQRKEVVLVVEWAEKATDVIPERAIKVHISWRGEKTRRIEITK